MPAKPKTPKSPRGTTKPEKGKVGGTPKKTEEKKAPAKKESGPRQAQYDPQAASPDVMWMLTKKWNAQKVRFNFNDWSKSPFSLTGFHNASQAANTVGVGGKKELTDKKTVRRIFSLTLKHKRVNGISKRKPASQRKPSYSVHEVRNEVNRTAKVIQSLSWNDDREKKMALRRLARWSWSMQPSLRRAAKAE